VVLAPSSGVVESVVLGLGVLVVGDGGSSVVGVVVGTVIGA
jgi:hypothetical protein